MKRINLCALILLLVTSISAYAGVTDGDVTAYRSSGDHKFLIFTDDPLDDPGSADGPLGVALMSGTSCAGSIGTATISGLNCIGTSGDPVADYTCTTLLGPPNDSNSRYCLFSENPRTGGKAWAVKYVNGEIPANDGDSIVRCEGFDTFDPVLGCIETIPSQISIEGGFIKLDTTDGNVPLDRNCSETAHNGRMVIDDVNDLLYICTDSGWISK